jgi:hypothetical protein
LGRDISGTTFFLGPIVLKGNSTASLYETINLFKKWTIVRPSCLAPKERSALKKKSSPIYLGPKNLLCNRINWVSRIEEERKTIKNNEEKNSITHCGYIRGIYYSLWIHKRYILLTVDT